MEHVPVGKRTRLQKSLINKNSRGNSGFSSTNDDDDDECLIIDKTDFLKSIGSNSEKKSEKIDVGIKKFTKLGSNLGRVYDHSEISKGLDNRVESIVNDEVVVEDDDDEEEDEEEDDDDEEEESEEEDEDENAYILVDVDDGNDSVRVDGGGNGGVQIDDGNDNVGVVNDRDDDIDDVDDVNNNVVVVDDDDRSDVNDSVVDDRNNDGIGSVVDERNDVNDSVVDDDVRIDDGVNVNGDGNVGVCIGDGNDNIGVGNDNHVDDENENENDSVVIVVDDDDDDVADDGNDSVVIDKGSDDVCVVDGNHDFSIDDGEDDVHVDDADDDIRVDNGNDDVPVDDDVRIEVDNDDDYDDDDDDDEEEEEEEEDDEEEEEVPEVKLRKFEGMVLPTHIIYNNVLGSDFIGKRTRSHYKSRHILNHGTPNSPISIDIDIEEEELSDHESNKPEYGEGRKKRGRPPLNKDDKVRLDNHDSGEKKKRGRPPLNEHLGLDNLDGREKKKRGRQPLNKKNKEDLELKEPRLKRLKTKQVQDVLLNAILENGINAGLNNNITSSVSQLFLPLKFGFEVKKMVPEISEEEQEVKSLFEDMEFALGVCDIGFEPPCLDNNDDEDDTAVPCDSAILQQKQCLAGKHCWIYDELIGIKCCFCSIVKLEIKYVTPDFNKNPFGQTKEPTYYGQFPYNNTKDSDRYQFTYLCNNIQGNDHRLPNDHFSGTVWDLIPGTARTLYPHQRDGFEFIWRNIAGGIKIGELAKATGSGTGGCIICHAPGTGKTRLAIVFLQSFLKLYPKSRPVIIAPYSMLRTWEEEFDKWSVGIPFYNLNEKELSGKENLQFLSGRSVKKSMKDELSIRIAKLHTWSKGGGVLAVTYTLFQRLAGEGKGVDEKIRRVILEQPDILVLDEGHTARNEKSGIVKVLSKVVTKRRVILSGTPFQNNLEELNTTIALVREEFGFLSSCNMNNNVQKIAKLRKQMAPFVHVHKGEILRDTLPGLFRSLIVLKPSDLQKNIYAHMARIRSPFLQFDNWISLTSVHPSIFCEIDSGFPLDKEQEALMKAHRMDLDAGPKIRFVVELIKLCKGERVLVFGQRLPCLSFIGDLFESIFDWTLGREFLYIDGSQNMKDRQSLIKFFNDPGSEARVLLASTKACCEGISLVGASRVVLLDVVWNPSVESQAVSRAYRIGQQKDVFVYHLITSGTLEEDKFRRQVTKEHYSKLLFSSSTASEKDPSEKETLVNKKSLGSKMVSEDRVLEEMTHHEKTKYMFERIVSQPKAGDDLIKSFD